MKKGAPMYIWGYAFGLVVGWHHEMVVNNSTLRENQNIKIHKCKLFTIKPLQIIPPPLCPWNNIFAHQQNYCYQFQ